MSPRLKARVAGVLYLITIVAGVIAQSVISERLVHFRDASATAANILAHKDLFRFGFMLYMIEMVAQTVMTMLFYDLLKPVSKSLSLVTAVLGVVGCVIKTMSRVFFLVPLFFNTEQLRTLALPFLRVNDFGAAVALIFFGFNTALMGYLIVRSTFLPHALGWLAVVGGVGWLAFLWPPLGYQLFLYIALFGILSSLATIVWLIVFGVNEPRWIAQAEAYSSPGGM